MRVAAFVGPSNSGKTTLIAALIRHFVTEGRSVSAIKHTHHPLNQEHRGDTATFGDAGADPVILADDRHAILFVSRSPFADGRSSSNGERPTANGKRIEYQSPVELLALCKTEIVFIEGFKNAGDWPRIELGRKQQLSFEEALKILDRIWRQC